MACTGKNNCLTDVEGIMVGHFTSLEAASGVTAIICLEGATAGVDVRGSAPGTRETDCLDPVNLVEKVQAIVLTGGSVYGLATVDGVVRWLAERGSGFALAEGHVAPIVPAAALFDLGRGKDYIPPMNSEWGLRACESATTGVVPVGSVGAGTGAKAGRIKGGLGTASEVLDSGITVAAIMAVNPLGSVINEATGSPWEIGLEINGEFRPIGKRGVKLPELVAPVPSSNTTIGVIATDAILTKAQAKKVSQMAHDGLARAIRPSHTMYDGDTIFCLSTGKLELPQTEGFFVAPVADAINEIGRAAADCTSRAIIRAVIKAHSIGTMIAFRDLEPL